jgi:Lon protease-like protein
VDGGRVTAETGAVERGLHLPMFPLSTVLFPHAQLPLHIFEPRYRAMTADCLAGDSRFGVVLIARGSEVGGGEERMGVGTRAVIDQAASMADGRWLLLVRGEARIRVGEWLADDPYPAAQVEEWPSPPVPVAESLRHEVTQCVRRTRGLLSESGEASALSADAVFDDDPDVACWQLCAQAPLSAFDAQRLLSEVSSANRMELLLELTRATEDDLRRLLGSS